MSCCAKFLVNVPAMSQCQLRRILYCSYVKLIIHVLNGASSGMYFAVSDQNYDGGLKLGQPEEPGSHFPLHC
jgi:hypothetical protein